MSETPEQSAASAGGSTTGSANGSAAYADRRARSEAKNQAVRDSLEPLAPGERPLAVTIAVFVALLLAATSVVLAIFNDPPNPADRSQWLFQTLIFAAVLLVCAVGMWRAKYWAVLGFQALLALQIIVFSLSLMVANSIWLVLRSVVIIGLAGVLFWHLIRAMARLQMPESPDAMKRRLEQEEAEENG